ncbi:MAG: MATE family efflux transporter [Angelakisella sp.]
MSQTLTSALDKKILHKRITVMIYPIIIENILQLFASLVSMSMLGRISTIAVSAQGVSSLLTGIIWNFFKGITIGATVLIANAYGAQDDKRMRTVAQQTLMVLVSLSLVIQFVVRFLAKPLLSIFDPTAEIMACASEYLSIVTFGFPFLAVMLCVTGFLQGKGDTKTPMIIATIMNLVNIVVSSTLIFGLFGVPSLGLTGAAIGLVSAQIAGACCGLWVLLRKGGLLHRAFTRENLCLRWDIIREVFRIGIPSGLETIFWQAASIILSRVILSFGDIAFAANQLGLQAESISEMPALGFGVAATAFTGQALGAGNKALGKEYIREIQKGAILIISVGTCILLFLPHQAMRILTNDPEVIALGAVYLRLMGLIQIPQNLQRVYTGSLKGAGYTKIPMLIAGIGLWGVRIPLALLLTNVFHTSIVSIWVVVCIDQTVRFILSYLFYRKRKIWDET